MATRLTKSLLWTVMFLVLFAPAAGADQSAVRLEVPDEVAPGTDVTVRVVVTHDGNNFFHYTDWVVVTAEDKEIARWAFSSGNRPEDEDFVREVTYTVEKPTTFGAQANCNIHGSAGPVHALVRVASPKAGD